MTTVTVKITPPDGSWQTAYGLIKQVLRNNIFDNLNIEVEDVRCANSGRKNTVIQQNGDNSPHAIFFNQQGGDSFA